MSLRCFKHRRQTQRVVKVHPPLELYSLKNHRRLSRRSSDRWLPICPSSAPKRETKLTKGGTLLYSLLQYPPPTINNIPTHSFATITPTLINYSPSHPIPSFLPLLFFFPFPPSSFLHSLQTKPPPLPSPSPDRDPLNLRIDEINDPSFVLSFESSAVLFPRAFGFSLGTYT